MLTIYLCSMAGFFSGFGLSRLRGGDVPSFAFCVVLFTWTVLLLADHVMRG